MTTVTQRLAEQNRLRAIAKALLPRALVTRRLRGATVPTVLLTFDDGPHPEITPAVLDRLDAHGAKAVFFLVGRRIKRATQLPAEIRRRGHLLGNHTHLHRATDVLANARRPRFAAYYRDTRRCQQSIQSQAGQKPRFFRPPGGRLTLVTLLVPRLLGMRCVTWSAEIDDWRFRTAAQGRAGGEQLLERVSPGDIVLLHDDNPNVLDLLDVLLPGLVARQYDLTSGIGAI